MNILEKFLQIFSPKDLSKPKSLYIFDHNLESCKCLLKELSPFYFEQNNNFDEGIIDLLIKLKKIEKRKD